MDKPVGFEIRKLSPTCGAEIIGLDLHENLPEQTIHDLRTAWSEHVVLVFRDLDLTEQEQLRFAGRFGQLGERKQPPEELRARTEGVLQTDQRVMLVSNMKVNGEPVGSFGDGDMWYHIDSGYSERPYNYTFLYGVELPSSGGNTLFSNMYAAYDALPDEMKQRLRGKKALHIHQYERRKRVELTEEAIENSPHWFHPIFITHSESKRKSLFVDRLMTQRIEGVSHEESEEILDFLYQHGEKRDFVYEHEWRLGDFVMWDNRCAIHARTWFPDEESRLLRRCTIEGAPVFEDIEGYL